MDETNVTETAEQQQATEEQERDYKALWEAAKADAEKWKSSSRKWESSSRSNADKAKAYDEAQAKSRTVEERLAALEGENRALRESKARADLVSSVAKATGVPADVVAMLNGSDSEQLTAQAQAIAEATKTMPSAPSAPEAGKLDHGADKVTKADLYKIKDPKERSAAIEAYVAQNSKE